MWNPKAQNFIDEEDDDESWEAKAFEQDTKGNISGSTWPPRSYTCNFCLREFRSAQALGGHMNVHRRDRAASKALVRGGGGGGGGGGTTLLSTCVAPLIIQSKGSTNIHEGLSHFYKLQNPGGVFFSNSSDMMNLYGTTSSFCSSNVAFSMLDSPGEVVPPPRLIEYSTRDDDDDDDDGRIGLVKEKTCAISVDEPDLELRLGHNPP
ncbi:unnamed protein product [Cochlearia groenlandica]